MKSTLHWRAKSQVVRLVLLKRAGRTLAGPFSVKDIRDHFVYISAAIILMSYVAISTYYTRFAILELIYGLPTFAILVEGIIATLAYWPAIALLTLIWGALILGEQPYALRVGHFKVKFSVLPMVAAPFFVWLAVAVGGAIGDHRYARDIGEDSSLPMLRKISFSDSEKCQGDKPTCLRAAFPAECVDDPPSPSCRVVLLNNNAIYVIVLPEQPGAQPNAQRFAMGSIIHVSIDTSRSIH